MIDDTIRPLLDDPAIYISTLKTKIKDEKEISNSNVVKVVTDKNGFALYFSRLAIPYVRQEGQEGKRQEPSAFHYKHIGLYVYRKDFLLKFAGMKPTPLEEAEKLEQLRVLENGYKIKVVETKYNSIGVDREEDLEKVRRMVERSRKSGVRS